MLNVGTVVASAGLDTKLFTSGLAQMHRAGESSVRAMSRKFDAMGDSLISVGGKLNRYVTLPLAAIGAAIFKLGSDFETNMSRIEGLVGVQREQLDAWRGDIESLSIETAKSMTELSDALFFVTSAGMRGAEAMSVLEMSAKASAAGLGETKTVADLLTSAINAYGIDSLSAAEATDILVAAVREGKAEAPELAQSMGMVLPIASELGVTFDQVGGAIAAMTRTGTDAGTASMQLRQILAALMKPSSDAASAMKEMGTSAGELRRQLREEGLVSVLGFLRNQMEENEDAMARVFPNIRALSGALDIMGANAATNAQILENMKDATGASDTAFQAVNRTAGQKLRKTLEQLRVTLTSMYDAVASQLVPIFEKVGNIIATLRDRFTSLDDEAQKQIVRWGFLVAAIGPATIAIGLMAKAIALILSPIGLAIAGLVAFVGGIEYVRRNTESFTAFFRDDWDRTVNDLIYNLQLALRGLNMFIRVLDPSRMGIEPVIAALEGLKRELPNREDGYGFQGFGEFVGDVTSDINMWLRELINRFIDVDKKINDTTQNAADAAKRSTAAFSGAVVPAMGFDRIAVAAGDMAVDVGEAAGAMDRAVKNASDNITGHAMQMGSMLQGVIAGSVIDFAETLGRAFTGDAGAGGFFNNILMVVADFSKQLGRMLVASGVAALAFQKLLVNPVAAIAAGSALIAASTVARKLLSTGPVQSVDDALITSSGKVVQFHPDDNILAMKDFSKLGINGRQNVHVTVDVRGKASGQDLIFVQERASNTQIRTGRR